MPRRMNIGNCWNILNIFKDTISKIAYNISPWILKHFKIQRDMLYAINMFLFICINHYTKAFYDSYNHQIIVASIVSEVSLLPLLIILTSTATIIITAMTNILSSSYHI